MTVVKTSDGTIFHLGRPAVEDIPTFVVSSILVAKNKPNNNPEPVRAMQLSDVELEEEREIRRKFEEIHPEESI